MSIHWTLLIEFEESVHMREWERERESCVLFFHSIRPRYGNNIIEMLLNAPVWWLNVCTKSKAWKMCIMRARESCREYGIVKKGTNYTLAINLYRVLFNPNAFVLVVHFHFLSLSIASSNNTGHRNYEIQYVKTCTEIERRIKRNAKIPRKKKQQHDENENKTQHSTAQIDTKHRTT